MSAPVLIPLQAELHFRRDPDPEPGDPVVLFDVEIRVRVDLVTEVASHFYARPDHTTSVSVEDIDLGVADWRQLSGKDVVFDEDQELDAAIYLATVHNPVELHRLTFGEAARNKLPAVVELTCDFRYVNPRPPELERNLRVRWEVVFDLIDEDDDD